MRIKGIDSDVTDWAAYYSKPKSKFSTATQKITLKKLLSYIEKYVKESCDIMELGGGNSCFAKDLIEKCHRTIKTYSIVDSCSIAVEKFRMMKLPGDAYLVDLTSDNILNEVDKKYDVVYSVGLIEHFRGDDIEKIVSAHFQLCKDGGIVLISVPTPTLQYRFLRKCMEILKVWRFPDEKPLCFNDIRDTLEKYGDVVETRVNKELPLTQLMVVVLKKENNR